jgi:hypothetical protein
MKIGLHLSDYTWPGGSPRFGGAFQASAFRLPNRARLEPYLSTPFKTWPVTCGRSRHYE